MKRIFVIIDCSGSIVSDGWEMVGTINEITQDLVREVSPHASDIRVICYSQNVKVHWERKSGKLLTDLNETSFEGPSNLGKAYAFIKKQIDAEKINCKDCVFVLISDGEATDNYRKQLDILDPDHTAQRVAISIGSSHNATDKHVLSSDCAFNRGYVDKDYFIDKVKDLAD